MNNWETALLPTHPWRSAMSIPRTLSLRKTDDGYRLIQTPVRELEALREEHFSMPDQLINRTRRLRQSGGRLEIAAVFEIHEGDDFGFRLRSGDREATVVGFDVESEELFVDRTNSGLTDFHDRFRGIHRGPMPIPYRSVSMHIFVDSSSIEVFGNGGYTVITDRIFPDAESRGIEVYSLGGSTRLVSLDVWTLKSIWHDSE